MRFETVFRSARVVGVRDLSTDVRELRIAPDDGPARPWSPGAHVQVQVALSSGLQTRSYSLVGDPGAAYRIAVKRDDAGRGGSRFMHGLRVGDALVVSDPANAFELDFRRPAYLLVAGGIGVTPIVGQALALARRGADLRVALCGRSRGDILFAEELQAALGARLSVHVSAEGGRLRAAQAIAGLPAGGEIYICGPQAMVDDFRSAWAAAGRPRHLFRTETFGSGGAAAARPFRVSVPALGRTIDVPANVSMLDALEAAGVEIVADCRRGECGLCALDVVAADAPIDHRDVFLSEAEKRSNRRICACVSRALGGEIVVDTGYRTDQAA